MRKQLASLLAAVAMTVLASAPARAADITFELSQISSLDPTSSLTVDGYTLLFTPTGPSGFNGNNDPNSGGLYVGAGSYGSFTIQKTAGSQDLIFKSYEINRTVFNTAGTRTFNLTGGTGTSDGNAFPATDPWPNPVSLNFNGPYLLASGQTVQFDLINFVVVPPNLDYVSFHSLTFTPVPEPSTYALGAIASGVLGYLARRRKANRRV